MRLQIVVPITSWQSQFSRYFWMIQLKADAQNGLSKDSAADAFQVKSLSMNRFQHNLVASRQTIRTRLARRLRCVSVIHLDGK